MSSNVKLTVGESVDVELVDAVGDVELRRAVIANIDRGALVVKVDERSWRVNAETLESRFVNGRSCRIVTADEAADAVALELLRRSAFRVRAVSDPAVARVILDALGVEHD